MPPYQTLIFDIGNVIVDIDYSAPAAAFKKLAKSPIDLYLHHADKAALFQQFEKGKISVPEFIEGLRKFLKPEASDEEIIRAWNSVLIAYPPKKFELLRHLKVGYRVLALSNINEIHVDSINRAVQEKFGASAFADYFHQAYYSNEVGFRKPEKEIYEWLIAKENIDPKTTFFVDDIPENVVAARAVGLQAYQLGKPEQLFALLSDLKIT